VIRSIFRPGGHRVIVGIVPTQSRPRRGGRQWRTERTVHQNCQTGETAITIQLMCLSQIWSRDALVSYITLLHSLRISLTGFTTARAVPSVAQQPSTFPLPQMNSLGVISQVRIEKRTSYRFDPRITPDVNTDK
jgi:hypothetical protein